MKPILSIILILLNLHVFGQKAEWKTETANNGATVVTSRVYTQKTTDNKSMQIAEYKATTTANLRLSACKAVMENTAIHKDYLEYTEISKTIQSVSDSVWVIYYYFDQPWPLSNADCVIKINRTSYNNGKTIKYSGSATPQLYKNTDAVRMQLNDFIYEFTELTPDKVEIKMSSKFSPAMSAPDWMFEMWFPDGPAGVLKSFIRLASKQ